MQFKSFKSVEAFSKYTRSNIPEKQLYFMRNWAQIMILTMLGFERPIYVKFIAFRCLIYVIHKSRKLSRKYVFFKFYHLYNMVSPKNGVMTGRTHTNVTNATKTSQLSRLKVLLGPYKMYHFG